MAKVFEYLSLAVVALIMGVSLRLVLAGIVPFWIMMLVLITAFVVVYMASDLWDQWRDKVHDEERRLKYRGQLEEHQSRMVRPAPKNLFGKKS